MHIQHIEIGNFRKQHAVRIDFTNQTTIFVGANNSGKTSAMSVLRLFLPDPSDFSINDFTLTNWPHINKEAVAGYISRFQGTNGHWVPMALHDALKALYRGIPRDIKVSFGKRLSFRC